MRIDAHQHFWDLEQFPYPWMPPEPSVLRHSFLPEHLAPILARNKFDGCVTVQATTVDGEAEWLLGLADSHAFILGVVAWVDLTSLGLPQRLDVLQRHPKFKGVRHPVHDESDDRWLLRADVLQGLKELERRDIPYDLLLRPQHLPAAYQLVEKTPGLRMVVDHIAKPEIAAGKREPWAQDLRRISEAPKVYVKLSGMITEAGQNWSSHDLRPYVEHVLQCFGPERCMFGSDWPVCLLAGRWKEVLAAFTQSHGALPKELRSRMTGENAAAFYGL